MPPPTVTLYFVLTSSNHLSVTNLVMRASASIFEILLFNASDKFKHATDEIHPIPEVTMDSTIFLKNSNSLLVY